MSNSLLLISLHSLRLSGDCHNIGRGLSLISCERACLRAWKMGHEIRKTRTDEGQTCDKLAPDGLFG